MGPFSKSPLGNRSGTNTPHESRRSSVASSVVSSVSALLKARPGVGAEVHKTTHDQKADMPGQGSADIESVHGSRCASQVHSLYASRIASREQSRAPSRMTIDTHLGEQKTSTVSFAPSSCMEGFAGQGDSLLCALDKITTALEKGFSRLDARMDMLERQRSEEKASSRNPEPGTSSEAPVPPNTVERSSCPSPPVDDPIHMASLMGLMDNEEAT